ncbi:hypothetical protein NMG60_11025929 [Bertholletia excelsa]
MGQAWTAGDVVKWLILQSKISLKSLEFLRPKLERNLHELIESRQQRSVEELEAALDSANQKLREKEREGCWSKDTARLISQQVPNSLACYNSGYNGKVLN